MSEKTAISWCDATFNPWWGCQKVSPACDHCYAERDAKRFAPGQVLWGVDGERRTFGDAHWQQPLAWAKRPFCECMSCGWRGPASKAGVKNSPAGFDRDPGAMRTCPQCHEPTLKEARQRVFCASMGDWLDLDAPLDEFVRLLGTIRKTPELDWLLLTKRIGNWRKQLEAALSFAHQHDLMELARWINAWLDGSAPANVWIGATVVNQEEADRDIPKLLAVPARVRFLSIEPMLGPVDLQKPCTARCPNRTCYATKGHPNDRSVIDSEQGGIAVECICSRLNGLHWIIAGGESGPHARPAHPDWFRSLAQQCSAAGAAFFMKQMGGHPDKRADMREFPAELQRQEFPT